MLRTTKNKTMLTLRSIKNAELTWPEVDGNFLYLENKIDDLEQLVNGDEVVKVTGQSFLPAQEDQARANIKAASAQELTALEERFDDFELVDYVTYSAQTMQPAQQQTARDNIDVYSRDEVNQIIESITVADQTIQDITIEEESQTVDAVMSNNIVRFNSVFPDCTITPGAKNGDTLIILNNAVSEAPFNINIPVILRSGAESDIFSIAPNKNYMFWFEQVINKWIDVSL